MIRDEGSQFASCSFHCAFDFALSCLPNFFRVCARNLANSFRFTSALALRLSPDFCHLLIQPAKTRLELLEPTLRLLLIPLGLFEFFDDGSSSVVENPADANLASEDVHEDDDEY